MRSSLDQVPRAFVVAAILFVPGMFMLARVLFPDFASDAPSGVALREIVLLALSAALALHALKIEQLPASALGWRPRVASLGWGFAVCVLLLVASVITISIVRALGVHQDMRLLTALARQPAWILVLVAATAGISEEIAFRGVLIDHVAALSGSRAVGAVFSVLAFCAFHVNGWEVAQFFIVLPSAIILTLFYLWKRDLAACVLAHALTDVVGLFSAAVMPHG